MDWRSAGVVIGVLAVACFVLVGAIVYPFSLSEPHAERAADEQFGGPTADEYHVQGEAIVDGKSLLAVEGAVTADGEGHLVVEEPTVRTERYQAESGGDVHVRYEVDDPADAQFLEAQAVSDDDRTLVDEYETDDGMVLVVVDEDATDLADQIPGSASVITQQFHALGYDQVDDLAGDSTGDSTGDSADGVDEEQADDRHVYEPSDDWYEMSDSYRITDATGQVEVDADTYAVTSADVSWEMTTEVGTYAEYRLHTWFGPDPETHEVSYELEPGEPEIERPEWVESE